MAEQERNSTDSSNTSNPGGSPITSRLLKRKSVSGVVLPKIKSKISKIIQPASNVRQHYLNPPGTKLREKVKLFGNKVKTNKQLPMTLATKKESAQKSQSWDKVEMLLQNGTSVENPTVVPPQPSLAGLSSGLPTGGQIIPPFDPPPVSDGEPSFIARRRARLSAQEEKSNKPTPKKTDIPQRPYSKIEEIHPKTSRFSKKIEEVSKPVQISEVKGNAKEPEEEIKQKSEIKTQKSDAKPEKIDKPRLEKSDQNQVVRRQIDETRPAKEKKDKSDFTEKGNEISRPIEEIKPSPDQEIREDLKTLSSKKSSSKIDKDQNSQQQVTSQKLEDKKLFKKIEEEKQSQPVIQPIREDKSPKEISFEKQPFSPEKKDKTTTHDDEKVSDQSKKKPQVEGRTFEGNVDDRIQKEINKEDIDQLANTRSHPASKSSEDTKKLDLPLASKTQLSPNRQDGETPQLIDQKLPNEQKSKKPEKTQPTSEKPEVTSQQKTIKPVPLKRELQESEEKRKTDRKEPPVSEKFVASKTPEVLDKPLVINRKLRQPEIKIFTNRIVNKNKQISQDISKPVFQAGLNKPTITPAEKPLIQRQISTDQGSRLVSNEQNVETSKEEKKSDSSPIDKPLRSPMQIQGDKRSLSEQPEKIKVDISPRNIRQRIAKTTNKSSKQKDHVKTTKQKLPIILKNISTEVTPLKPTLKDVSAPGSQTVLGERWDFLADSTPVQKGIGKPSTLRDRLLVSSAGRKSIQRKIEKSVHATDKNLTEHEEITGAPPVIIPGRSQQKPDGRISKNQTSETAKSAPSPKTKTSGSEKVILIPLQSKKVGKSENSLPKPSDMELPVVKTKKVESPEPYFTPEMAVQGPVVQRIIEDSSENKEATLDTTTQAEMKVDLEKLAKDVYPIIKRWIAIEKERSSGRLF